MSRTVGTRDYGIQYRMPFGSHDGFQYRVDIYVLDASDAGTPTELTPAESPVEIMWGRPGGVSTLWQPIVPSEFRFRFIATSPSALAELISGNSIDSTDPYVKDDQSIIAVLQYTGGSTWVDAWAGYILPDTVTDYAFETGAVEITAYDGFGLWRSQVYEPPSEYTTFLDSILNNLNEISALTSGYLYTMCRWFPFRESSDFGSGVDPLDIVATHQSAWSEDELNTLRYDVASQMVGRFGMELFQSDGSWWCVQPYQLNAAVFTPASRGKIYNNAGSTVYAWDTTSITKASSLYDFTLGTARALSGPVKDVAVNYDFTPELDLLHLNASFEIEDTAGGTVSGSFYAPLYWTVTQGTTASGSAVVARVPIANLLGDSPAEDTWALKMGASISGGTRGVAVQDNILFIPANQEQVLSIGAAIRSQTGGGTFSTQPELEVNIDGYAIVAEANTLRDAQVRGKEVTLYLGSAIGNTETNKTDGVAVMPVGADVPIFRTTSTNIVAKLTLSEPAKIGDLTLVGTLDEDILSSDIPVIYYFSAMASSYIFALDMALVDISVHVVSPEGDPLTDWLRTEFRSPEDNDDTMWVAYDSLAFRLEIDGQPVRSYTWESSVDRRGQSLETNVMLTGDGPALDSASSLFIDDGSSGYESSLQGGNMGWQNGPYSGGATSGRTIDQHMSRELLRTTLRGVEERNVTLILRDKERFQPHNVLTYPHEVTAETMYLWRRHMTWDVKEGLVSGVFQRLYYDTSESITEAITALSEGSGLRRRISTDTYVPPAPDAGLPTFSGVNANYQSGALPPSVDTFGPWTATHGTEVVTLYLFIHPTNDVIAPAWDIVDAAFEGWNGSSWDALTTTSGTSPQYGDSIKTYSNNTTGYTQKRVTIEVNNLFSQKNPHRITLMATSADGPALTQTNIEATQS